MTVVGCGSSGGPPTTTVNLSDEPGHGHRRLVMIAVSVPSTALSAAHRAKTTIMALVSGATVGWIPGHCTAATLARALLG